IEIPQLMRVSPGCLTDLSHLLSDFDLSRVCVGSGDGPSVAFADAAARSLRANGHEVVRQAGLAGTLDQAAGLAARVIREEITLLVAVGGGRVIDTVKLAAARTGTAFVSAPTTISHDGISSPVASLVPEGGHRTSYAASMPAAILVDLDVIASAPPRTLRAGAGDLISNLTALLDWQLADSCGRDRFDPFAAMIAESASRPLLQIRGLDDPDVHELLAKGLLQSGLAMAAAGTSRPCSGAEHLISHSLDAGLAADRALHGEQVALGSLFSAAAHGSELLPALRDLYRRIGLPCCPEDLGLSQTELEQAIRSAPSSRPERYTILTELVANGEEGVAEVFGRAYA
ncbi:MAG: iron-containing alcohol dehydrogenase family protein, partial [Actinomycetota bacterium]|nr:iron-containing alcohol dehydrogenase family protein [Actinomycetota bacterium]